MLVVWATYGTFYFCRVNLGPARTTLQHDVGLTALEMGFIFGALKVGYAVGQFVNGQLAERYGPKRVLVLGMAGSAAATLVFAFVPQIAAAPFVSTALPGIASAVTRLVGAFGASTKVSPLAALFLLVWLANGYFQACGWPPCVKVMSNWFSLGQRGRMMGVLGTSYQLGSTVTLLAAGWLVTEFGDSWRAACLVPAAALVVSMVHTALRLKESPADGEAPAKAPPPPPPPAAKRESSLLVTLTNPRVWILALALFGLDTVRYGFLDWAPGHLKEVQGTGVSVAALKTAVFPFAGVFGALTSGWLSDRFFQSRRAPVITSMILVVGVLTLAYHTVVGMGTVPTVACLGLAGFFLYGAQILLVGTAAQDFARARATAAAAGFVDFMGNMGAFTGDIVTGALLKGHDWHGVTRFWAMSAFGAAAMAATLWRARPHGEE
jgi:MFS transporter, OPA family, glycerol-3-phosphate transporter